jgi:glycosyltransferase involved in cell wall biosynthesis
MVSIGVVIPCFNHNHLVMKALQSLTQLHVQPSHVVVVDDGSDIPVVLPDVAPTFNLSLLRIANGGLANARNQGLRLLNTDWLVFLDADDYLYPNAFDFLPDIANTTKVDIFVSNHELINGSQRRVVKPLYSQPINAILQSNIAPIHAYVFRRDVLNQYEGFDTTDLIKGGHEDYELLFRLLVQGAALRHVDNVACAYIKYANSMSANKVAMAHSRLRVWLRHFPRIADLSVDDIYVALLFLVENCQLADELRIDEEYALALEFWRIQAKNKQSTLNISVLKSMLQNAPDWLGETLLADLSDIKQATYQLPSRQNVFDWRVRYAHFHVAYQRLKACLSAWQLQSNKQLIVYGCGEIAREVLPFIGLITQPKVVDSFQYGHHFAGFEVADASITSHYDNALIYIASETAWDEIYTGLMKLAVDPKAIY